MFQYLRDKGGIDSWNAGLVTGRTVDCTGICGIELPVCLQVFDRVDGFIA
jgi:hypothetical protein